MMCTHSGGVQLPGRAEISESAVNQVVIIDNSESQGKLPKSYLGEHCIPRTLQCSFMVYHFEILTDHCRS